MPLFRLLEHDRQAFTKRPGCQPQGLHPVGSLRARPVLPCTWGTKPTRASVTPGADSWGFNRRGGKGCVGTEGGCLSRVSWLILDRQLFSTS